MKTTEEVTYLQETRPRKFNWKLHLLLLFIGALAIGQWLFLLIPITVAELTRSNVILYSPKDIELVLATFLMLTGVATVSIVVTGMIEQIIARYIPPEQH